MFPPLFATLYESTDVKALLGSAPLRIYLSGDSPEPPQLPYATWQTITGLPENYLNQVPDVDGFTTQIDAYGATLSDARNAAEAMRDALEPVAYITSLREWPRDKDTRHYRYSMDVDWLTPR